MTGVIQRGRGKDLVLLHGYLSSKESFYPQIEYFSKFYRVTAFDFPGFGEAEPLKSAYSVGDYADWTEKFLKEAGIENPGEESRSNVFHGEICSTAPYFAVARG